MRCVTVLLLVVLNLFPVAFLRAQVGIGNTNPNASLDISASNQATPNNNDGLLIPRIDAFPAINPTINQHSMMVFLTSTDGIKTPGFYYWDDTLNDWVKFSASSENEEWTDGGSYLYPTDGNDKDVMIGGSGFPLARLNVASDRNYGILNSLTNNSSATAYSIYNAVSNSGSGDTFGHYNSFTSSGSGRQIGFYNAMVLSGSAKTGLLNFIGGSGEMRGVNNDINADDGWVYGMYNNLGSQNGYVMGTLNYLNANGPFPVYGTFNEITQDGGLELYGSFTRFTNNNGQNHYGSYNTFNSSGAGGHYGQYNFYNNSSGTNVGLHNEMFSAGVGYGVRNNINSNGDSYGIWNNLSGSGSTITCGIWTEITDAGANAFGARTHIHDTGSTEIAGSWIQIDGSSVGAGNKWGYYSRIDPSAGGTHYGIFSEATKPGSYSGYFVGDVAIRGIPTIGNPGTDYSLPITDGTSGSSLQTDGAGNVSWVSDYAKPYVTTGAATGNFDVLPIHYTIRVFNGVSSVTLPAAASNPGRIYILIGSNGIGLKNVLTAGGLIYDDVTNAFINTISSNERFTLQSDGIDWIVIGR